MGLKVVALPRDELRKRYGDVVGYRDGDYLLYASDLDPLTQRAVLGHEYNEDARKTHEQVQKDTELLFRRLGDYSALQRTYEIGKRLAKLERRLAMPDNATNKDKDKYTDMIKKEFSKIIDETGLGYVFDLFTGEKKRTPKRIPIRQRMENARENLKKYKLERLKGILSDEEFNTYFGE